MNRDDLIKKKKKIAPEIIKSKQQVEVDAVEYDELTKFPELKKVIVDLLTHEFAMFLSSIEWVAPRPTTFRINLKNNQEFYLEYGKRSWICQVEGKKYYLLNLPEEERAADSIARILRYGSKEILSPQSDEDIYNEPDKSSPEPETEIEPEETT